MAMKLKKGEATGAICFNFTPLISVVFNLLIFFVLTAQFSALEVSELELPVSKTAEPKDYSDFRNVVINITNPDKPTVVIMGREIDPKMDLINHLKELNASAKADNAKMNVILRADKRIQYEWVARVMLAAGYADIQGWWIQAVMPRDEK